MKDQLNFDQIIWENGNDLSPDWIHVSFNMNMNRRQVLKLENGSYNSY